MKIKFNFSSNYTAKTRSKRAIRYVIIHYTGMQSEIESIKRLKDPKYKVSCHYLINRKGEIIQMVKDNHAAWHAGKSKWKKIINLNNNSIGIELVNKGHRYGYQNFTLMQISSLIKLCKSLKKKYKISKENFLGHSDIAPLRKSDPGEKFPWQKLGFHNLGQWYKKKDIILETKKNYMRDAFFRNLKKLGYRYFSASKSNYNDKKIIKSFQRHYLPNNITGKIDLKTFKISHFLIN